jgi:3-oxoadipate enol-lactonase
VRIGWQATGDGHPVLLIQGLGYGRWGWDPVVPGLAERYRVISFDNRGIGESEVPEGPYTAAEMADDALQVLDEAGAGRAHVVGASLGGMIAQEPAVALRRFVENALGAAPPIGLADELFALRLERPPDPVGWQAQAAAGTAFPGTAIESIAAPTLVLHGSSDNVVDHRNAPLLAGRIPDARVELVDGGGHLFFWEQPDRFVRSVTEFLG